MKLSIDPSTNRQTDRPYLLKRPKRETLPTSLSPVSQYLIINPISKGRNKGQDMVHSTSSKPDGNHAKGLRGSFDDHSHSHESCKSIYNGSSLFPVNYGGVLGVGIYLDGWGVGLPPTPLTCSLLPLGLEFDLGIGLENEGFGDLHQQRINLEFEMGYEHVRRIEEVYPRRLRESMDIRSRRLERINPEAVRLALYGLLNSPSTSPPLAAMAILSRTLGLDPSPMPTMVDDQSNPWSEHILTFIDTFLVLYSPVATALIPLRYSHGQAGENDETDQKAFRALTATSLAPRILILIPHAHHHLLKSLWFSLIYLSIAYWGTKRGVAVEFLIERIYEEWNLREERAKKTAVGCWGKRYWEKQRESEWYKRARRVGQLRNKLKHTGGIRLGMVCKVMKGDGDVDNVQMGSLPTPQIGLDAMRSSFPLPLRAKSLDVE